MVAFKNTDSLSLGKVWVIRDECLLLITSALYILLSVYFSYCVMSQHLSQV